MPSPSDRKKSKQKKKNKESSHRSISKHKSKKKKQSRSQSRNKEKRKDYRKDPKESPHINSFHNNKGMTDTIFYEMLKKITEFKDGNKKDDNGQQMFPFAQLLSQQQQFNDPIQEEIKQQVEKPQQQKIRLLIPFVLDSLMLIIDDPFYQEYLSPTILRHMKKKLISAMKKSFNEQKELLQKLSKLEQDLKKTQLNEEQQPSIQLDLVQSLFELLKFEKKSNIILDPQIQDLYQSIDTEQQKQNNSELYEDAKLLIQ